MKKFLLVLLLCCGSVFLIQSTNALADDPPVITGGPFVAGGYWPLLSADEDFPSFINQDVNIVWTFSDDFASCSGECTHIAKYKVTGTNNWNKEPVTAVPAEGYAMTTLPIVTLKKFKTYMFRFEIEDCDNQKTESPQYYFAYGIDADDDGIDDEEDNCEGLYNPNQRDADKDDIGDCCDESPGCTDGPVVACSQNICDSVCGQ